MCSTYGEMNISIAKNKIKPANDSLTSVPDQSLRNVKYRESKILLIWLRMCNYNLSYKHYILLASVCIFAFQYTARNF